MAQYEPFAPNVEVNGDAVLSFVNALPEYKQTMLNIMRKHGVIDPQAGNWYSQAGWLAAFKEVGEGYGASTLFAIGKAIPENAQFPPEINDLEGALNAINMAYHMNHRNGEIGYYKVISFNKEERVAFMECKNPYPSNFDRGIIITMARKFKPEGVIRIEVELEKGMPTRLEGADACTYRISW